MASIDINVDAGESFGRWQVSDEKELFPQVSSVNLACGFHAGDPLSIQKSVNLAADLGVAIGAHPSFKDLVGFGRRLMAMSSAEIKADIIYQLGALNAFLQLRDQKMHHVKPHGALYLGMMKDKELAKAVSQAIFDYDKSLPLVVLAGSGGELMRQVARNAGLQVVNEAFPDRAYLANGQLAPRSMKDAVLNNPGQIAKRAVAMAKGESFASIDGGEVRLNAVTLCVHGDNSNSAITAKAIKTALDLAGIKVKAF